MAQTGRGRYFEDFRFGQSIDHPIPRTLTESDATLYLALTGSRYPLYCATPVARSLGLSRSPIDPLLAFHVVFGRTVGDISLNAIANLGYADLRIPHLVYPGDTLRARSRVVGLKETSSRQSGIVYVHTQGLRDDTVVIEFHRWVLVAKRDPQSPAPETVLPDLPALVMPERLVVPADFGTIRADPAVSGCDLFYEDLEPGLCLDHHDGMGVTESEHRLATRLYQNNARVHFDDHTQRGSKLGRTIVYGGVVISLAHTLAFNALGNMAHVLAINAGSHVNPCVAGDTVFAWSKVLDRTPLEGRTDAGATRMRLIATRNRPCADFPERDASGRYLPEVLLDLDYWVLMPRRQQDVIDKT